MTVTPRALRPLGELFAVMEEIAVRHGKSIVHVVLNWLLSTDPLFIPIPGAKNVKQARENAGAIGWRLSPGEYESISSAEIAGHYLREW
jgi:aryl-alcohol dehydrogenase-like predicted oxidoreductase